ncbi:MAG: O-antigen ligase family protein [Nitrospinota bacterium]
MSDQLLTPKERSFTVACYALYLLALAAASSITIIELSEIVIIISIILFCIRSRELPYLSVIQYPILAFIITTLILIPFSVNPLESLYENKDLVHLLLFFACYIIFSKDIKKAKISLFLLAAGSILMFLKLSMNIIADISTFPLHNGWADYNRIRSTGLVAMMISTFSLSIFLFSKESTKERLFYLLMGALGVFTIFATNTRSALVGLVGALIFLAYKFKPISLLLIPLLCITGYLLVPQTYQERILEIGSYKKNIIRIALWDISLDIIKDYPITGTGRNSLRDVIDNYDDDWNDIGLKEDNPGHSHNNIFQIGMERGLIGLSLWLVYAIIPFIYFFKALSLRTISNESRAIILATITTLIGFHIAGWFDSTFNATEVAIIHSMLLAAGLAYASNSLAKDRLD